VPAYSDGFAARLLERAGVGVDSPAGSLLQAFGPARTYQTVSYYQALDPAGFLPEGIFRDRIVIVGMSMQSAAGIDQGGPDNFATSYTPRSRRLVPGAEIQATVVDNLAGRLAIAPAGSAAGFAAIVFAALCAGVAVLRRTGWATAAVAGAAVVAAVLASFLLLRTGRVFLAPTGPALAFLLVAGVQSARDFSAERLRRRQITRAFSQYLSPVLVSRLAGDPAQLKLGGERRTLTVLFMDVRGFTTISEEMKHDPEGLTRLMNRLFNPLSDEILKTGGTIDKYIGDAIMAFWNAPVEDPDHAVHAIQAARAMLKAVDALNAERAREVLRGAKATPLKIGIGINTGDCVVGNIGSDFRFNYSALGDPVNLASRLESETKGRHLDILVGEQTARQVGARLPLAPVGRIKVKGKSEAVSVFTPVDARDHASLETHRLLMEAVEEGEVLPDDPRFEALAAALPQLAGFYAACVAALRLSG